MLLDFATLALFIPTVFVVVITPGPDLIFITANAIASGKKGGVACALGCSSAAFMHTVFAALGLSALVAASQAAYDAIRILGALYLAYLGLKMLLSKESPLSIKSAGRKKSYWQLYRQGFITNLMNPKAVLFTLTFLPQFTNPARGPVWAQLIFLGIILGTLMLLIEIPIALTSGQFGQWVAGKKKLTMAVNRTLGLTLLGLAAWVSQSRRVAP